MDSHVPHDALASPELLAGYAQEFSRRGIKVPFPIFRTDLWRYWCYSAGGTRQADTFDPGRPLFYKTPWLKGHPPHSCNVTGKPPVVLVARGWTPDVGVVHDLNLWRSRNHGDDPRVSEQKRRYWLLLFVKHGLNSVVFRGVNEMAQFWEGFFGCERFLDRQPEELVLPRVILTNDQLRNHPEIGAETCQVFERLREIGQETGTPVELI